MQNNEARITINTPHPIDQPAHNTKHDILICARKQKNNTSQRVNNTVKNTDKKTLFTIVPAFNIKGHF